MTDRHAVAGVGDVTPQEIYQLWSFLDGSIMCADVRHHLWRSWGLCERHAWAYAAAEIELRGGRPFSTAILYEDLVGRAAQAVATVAVPWPLVVRRLRSRDTCFTCDYTGHVLSSEPPGSAYEQAAAVNRLERATRLLHASCDEWASRRCRVCASDSRGPVCRPHLLSGEDTDRAVLLDDLRELRDRLRIFVRSMTHRGPTATPRIRASWVEALGWFAGWSWPTCLVGHSQGLDAHDHDPSRR